VHTVRLSPHELEQAVAALRRGELVAFPTETVYGLGADGFNPAACAQIFAVKGRPADNPLILHVASIKTLEQLSSGPVPPVAWTLAQAFWPGPLTVVIKADALVPEVVRGGLDTVAVRAPKHWVAQALIRQLGHPIAAPSANLSGKPSPTTADDVWNDLAGKIGWIIDGGPADVGVESTVVDCTSSPPRLLRPGGLPAEAIEAVVGPLDRAAGEGPARAPGMKYRHYAPEAPVKWIQTTDVETIAQELKRLGIQHQRIALLAPEKVGQVPCVRRQVVDFASLGDNAEAAARNLFRGLRALDRRHPEVIVIVWETVSGIGLAVANRIQKASAAR
jgi:L-threonylcarbamoyladenylate synthase